MIYISFDAHELLHRGALISGIVRELSIVDTRCLSSTQKNVNKQPAYHQKEVNLHLIYINSVHEPDTCDRRY